MLNLYQHVNSPEGRLYLSRQLFEEAVHVQFYLNLLDTYVPDETERAAAFDAVENIPSIARKAEFCFRWIDSIYELRSLVRRVCVRAPALRRARQMCRDPRREAFRNAATAPGVAIRVSCSR